MELVNAIQTRNTEELLHFLRNNDNDEENARALAFAGASLLHWAAELGSKVNYYRLCL
jgi:hypothetical protein